MGNTTLCSCSRGSEGDLAGCAVLNDPSLGDSCAETGKLILMKKRVPDWHIASSETASGESLVGGLARVLLK